MVGTDTSNHAFVLFKLQCLLAAATCYVLSGNTRYGLCLSTFCTNTSSALRRDINPLVPFLYSSFISPHQDHKNSLGTTSSSSCGLPIIGLIPTRTELQPTPSNMCRKDKAKCYMCHRKNHRSLIGHTLCPPSTSTAECNNQRNGEPKWYYTDYVCDECWK